MQLLGNHPDIRTFGNHLDAGAEQQVALFRKTDRIGWAQLTLAEHIIMMAMTVEPQKRVEWLVQRALCFHGLTEITPQGLKLTHLGRRIIAERHGLPVVVGREPEKAVQASSAV